MSNFIYTQTIKNLEVILQKAKYRDPSQNGSDEYEEIVIDAYNAMSQIEKNRYIELIPYLYDFAEDQDEYLREKAVSSFGGFRADQVPEFREKAFKIWTNKDEDDVLKFIALGIWYGFYQNTQDKKVLNTLYQLLINNKEPNDLRARARVGILSVSGHLKRGGESCFPLGSLENANEFNKAIDWKEINDIICQYAPESLEKNH